MLCRTATSVRPLRACAGSAPAIGAYAPAPVRLREEGVLQHGEEDRIAPARSPLAVISLLMLLLVELCRARSPEAKHPRSASLPPPIVRAIIYIEQHGLESISLQDLAEVPGRSPAHLTTTLREATGQSSTRLPTASDTGPPHEFCS